MITTIGKIEELILESKKTLFEISKSLNDKDIAVVRKELKERYGKILSDDTLAFDVLKKYVMCWLEEYIELEHLGDLQKLFYRYYDAISYSKEVEEARIEANQKWEF